MLKRFWDFRKKKVSSEEEVSGAGHHEGADSKEIDVLQGDAAFFNAPSVEIENLETPRIEEPEALATSWWQRLKGGLTKSSARLGQGLKDIFVRRKLDQEMLDDLEELLISADLGFSTSARLTAHLAAQKLEKDLSIDDVKQILATEIEQILEPVARPLYVDATHQPFVVLVVGVNGAGKTTTIGKLAKKWMDDGMRVHLAAGDTFRAAAVAQLQAWGARVGAPVSAGPENGDAAALIFDAYHESKSSGKQVLIADTAGRLHNKKHLMEELQKIVRVLKKADETAPHATILVLDATTGQNSHQQVEIFGEAIGVTGLVMTKLDGTARGGCVVALADRFKLPIHAVGVGESVEDLQPFSASEFAAHLLGVDEKI